MLTIEKLQENFRSQLVLFCTTLRLINKRWANELSDNLMYVIENSENAYDGEVKLREQLKDVFEYTGGLREDLEYGTAICTAIFLPDEVHQEIIGMARRTRNSTVRRLCLIALLEKGIPAHAIKFTYAGDVTPHDDPHAELRLMSMLQTIRKDLSLIRPE